ncbi:MAG TPA: hypothetical protein VNU93_05450, partial [Verrucomicrobiae bacterium]|nr:hypothetical protein [Verrucomicrobiae bacterium]
MANPSDHQTAQQGKGKISPFGCFVLGIMMLVVLGGVAQLLTAKPNFKIVFLVILLAGVSLLVLYQVIKSGSGQENKHLNLDYRDRVLLEYLGMDEAYLDEG